MRSWLYLWLFLNFVSFASQAEWQHRGRGVFEFSAAQFPQLESRQRSFLSARGNLYAQMKKGDWRVELKPKFLYMALPESFQSYVDLEKLWVSRRLENHTFKLGNEVVNWSVLEGFSSLDRVNNGEIIDPLRSQKLSSTLLSWNWQIVDDEVNVVIVPRQRTSILPSEDSPFLPRNLKDVTQAFVSTDETVDSALISDTPEYIWRGDRILDFADRDNFFVRYQKRGSFGDFSVVGFQAMSSQPIVSSEVNGEVTSTDPVIVEVDNPIRLTPIYYRTRGMALGFVKSFDYSVFRLELQAENNPTKFEGLPQDSFFVGANYEWTGSVLGLNATHLLQWINREVNYYGSNSSSFSSPFAKSAQQASLFEISEKWGLQWMNLFSLERYGWICSLSVTYEIADSLTLQSRFVYFDGDAPELLNLYTIHDFFQLGASWTYITW